MFETAFKTVIRDAVLLLVAVFLVGCGGSHTPTLTDSKKAATSLHATLEKWKNGASIDALQKEKPAVYVVDEDWQAGLKLVSYELRDVVDQGGVTIRIPVRLNIQSPNGVWWKEVEYRVSTEPFVSVARQDTAD